VKEFLLGSVSYSAKVVPNVVITDLVDGFFAEKVKRRELSGGYIVLLMMPCDCMVVVRIGIKPFFRKITRKKCMNCQRVILTFWV